ncbi:MAG: phosphoribosylaminoimidazolesuccinocarboxamide synthase [Candidatus Paceibacterota bacterium]
MTHNNSYAGSSRTLTAERRSIVRTVIGDYWSAGDKGRSNQPISGMGAARHRCALQSFALAHQAGVQTHFVREVEGGFLVRELRVPTHEPLSGFTHGEVLPLEFIWRLYLMGSLWQRVESGEIDPRELGFSRGYQPFQGEPLPKPRLECTTKYEPIDRKVSNEEACDLAKMSTREWQTAWALIVKVAQVTDQHAQERDFYFPDGKMELGRLDDGQLILADTFGTPDENRVVRMSNGFIYSKDLIRNYLKEVGYMEALKTAQSQYPQDPSAWPDYPKLPLDLVAMVESRYTAFAACYAG